MNRWRPLFQVLLAVGLLGIAGAALALDQTQNENVLLFDGTGQLIESRHAGDWPSGVNTIGGSYDVKTQNYGSPDPDSVSAPYSFLIPVGSSTSAVPNDLRGTYPPAPAGSPPASLYSFGASIPSGTVGLTYSPAGGTFSQTILLSMQAYPAAAVVEYSFDGGGSWTAGANHTALYIYKNTTVEMRAMSGGSYSPVDTAVFTIDQDPHVDSDQDGIPDAVEVTLGMNPLESDADMDSDGDHWSNLDEIVRDSDPFCDPAKPVDATNPCSGGIALGLPTDNDHDGWPDWDEFWRNTNPSDDTNLPTARALYEVERQMSGTVSRDNGGVTPMGGASYEITSLASVVLASGVTNAAGAVQARVPVGEPGIFRVWGDPHVNFSVKHYLYSSPSPTPADVSPATWDTPSEWLAALRVLYQSRLLETAGAFDIQPGSTYTLALFERELEVLAGHPDGTFLFAGTSTHAPGSMELELLDTILGLSGRRVNTLLGDAGDTGDLRAVLAEASACGSTLLTDSNTLYSSVTPPADPSTSDENRVEIGLGNLYQQTEGRYLAALTLFYPWEDILTSGFTLCSVLNPMADVDGDGLSNAAEVVPASVFASPSSIVAMTSAMVMAAQVSPIPPGTSNPFDSDTDGDGVPDGTDNCPGLANGGQANFDGDAQGDVCDDDDDNDGLDDGFETAIGSDPLNPDTDGNGVNDGTQFAQTGDPGTTIAITHLLNPTNQIDQTVKGTMESGATVDVFVPAGAGVAVSYPGSSTWNASVTTLAEGLQTVTFRATDPAGNTAERMVPILVDLTPPMTSVSPPGGPDNTYFGNMEVTLSCDDGGGAGCSEVRYCTEVLSGPGCLPLLLYGAPLILTEPSTVWYQSIDAAGNVEDLKSVRYAVLPTIDVTFAKGFNLFAYPGSPGVGYTSYQLLLAIGSSAQVERIGRISGGVVEWTYYSAGAPAGDAFDIVPGEGYIVDTFEPVAATLTVTEECPVISRTLVPGANLVSLPCPTSSLTSRDFIQQFGDSTQVGGLQRFNRTTGVFETTTYGSGGVEGANFPVKKGEGYILHRK